MTNYDHHGIFWIFKNGMTVDLTHLHILPMVEMACWASAGSPWVLGWAKRPSKSHGSDQKGQLSSGLVLVVDDHLLIFITGCIIFHQTHQNSEIFGRSIDIPGIPGAWGRTATRPNKALAVYAAVVNVLETCVDGQPLVYCGLKWPYQCEYIMDIVLEV